MSVSTLRRGDEVAILPIQGASPKKVIAIVQVIYVGTTLIELSNGCVYFIENGQGMNIANCIEPVTEEHRVALNGRGQTV
jgi:hypothetical protein